MKKIASALVCLFLAVLLLPLLALPARAYSDETWEWEVQYNEATITKYKGSDAEVTIPSIIGTNYKVTKIGNRAFEDKKTLEKVYIPSIVTSIGQSAFSGCSNLQTINGASGIDYIDKFAFAYCSSLESWAIPSGVEVINDYVFFQCTGLRELTIPDSVAQIKYYAFNGCDSLAKIYYGGNYEQWCVIDIYNENGCNDDLVNATIWYVGTPIVGSGVCGAQKANLSWVIEEDDKCRLRISGTGDMADYTDGEDGAPWADYSTHLEEIEIGPGVTGIGAYAFDQCWYVTDVEIPSTVQRIGAYAFRSCEMVESVTIPSGVKTISNGAFQSCWNLTDVTIPSGVTDIGEYAFYNCYGMKNISIPGTVKTIGFSAFGLCSDLQAIVIPDGVTAIEIETFYYCNNLREVRIPGTVKGIGESAFASCDALTDVYFGGTQAEWTTLMTKTGDWNDDLRTANIHYKPVISKQPQSIASAPGKDVQFTVTATGESLSYQWQVCEAGKTTWKNSPATGNQTATLTIPATTSRNGYKYRCVVTNKAGKTVSAAATLTVATAPKITTQPTSVTKAAGSGNATFKVVASGTGLSYQWQYLAPGGSWKNSPATGNTTATLTVPATMDRNGYKYRCIVKNAGGSVTSSAATLTVTAAKPTITTQPSNASVAEGSNATFKVVASGTGLSYQWQVSTNGGSSWSNSPATGNKTATLTVPATMSRNGYKYRCNVTNSGGTTTSAAATLTVTSGKPAITTQPANATVKAGSNATFKVVASGAGLTYQWQVCEAGSSTWKDSPATGNKTATLTVPATASRDGYKYRCIVKNSSGTTTSSAATLTVLAITLQPQDRTAIAGNNASFMVKATGTGLTYQWQVSTNGGSSWSDSPATGNKTATLTVPATMSRNGYKYRCIVKIGSLSVTSSAATLTVISVS